MACVSGFDTETGQPCGDEGGKQSANRDLGGGFSMDASGGVYFAGQPVSGETYQQYLADQQNREFQQAADLRSRPTFSSSTSSSVNQSLRDPADIALDRERLAIEQEQFAIKRQQLEQQMRRDAIMDQFARDKFNQEMELGKRADARATQSLWEQIQSRQQQNELSRAELGFKQAQLDQNVASLQAEMDFSAAQQNARAASEADQINESRRQFNLEQRRGVAKDIGEFAQNPGSVGANAAYLLAGGAPTGPAAISQAVAAGQDARTPQALVPLDLLLGTREELAKGPNLFSPQMVTAPRVPQAPRVPMPLFQNQPMPVNFGAPAGGGAAAPTNFAQAFGAGTFNPAAASGGFTGSVDASGNLVATPVAAAAEGGMMHDEMFLGNEEGPELFMNPTGAPIMVVDADTTEKMMGPSASSGGAKKKMKGHKKGTTKPKGYASGTLDQLFYGGNQQVAKPGASLDFLNQALMIARRGTPWQTGPLPTPVSVSAPGTSPFVQQAAAGLTALGTGVNPGLFLSEAQQATPLGLSGAPTRRSR